MFLKGTEIVHPGVVNIAVEVDGQQYLSGGYFSAPTTGAKLEAILYEETDDLGGCDVLPNATARRFVRAQIVELCDQPPECFESMVEQVTSRAPDGTAYVRTITILTDGADHTDDWDTTSIEDRRHHDEWVESLHDALVDIAWADPAVRERVAELQSTAFEINGDVLGDLLQQAQEEADTKVSG